MTVPGEKFGGQEVYGVEHFGKESVAGAVSVADVEVYGVEEMAKCMGVGVSTVLGILRAGLVPYCVVEGECRIPKECFRSWWEGLLGDMEELY